MYYTSQLRRDGRAVECTSLENWHTLIAYLGFKSLSLRHFTHRFNAYSQCKMVVKIKSSQLVRPATANHSKTIIFRYDLVKDIETNLFLTCSNAAIFINQYPKISNDFRVPAFLLTSCSNFVTKLLPTVKPRFSS